MSLVNNESTILCLILPGEKYAGRKRINTKGTTDT